MSENDKVDPDLLALLKRATASSFVTWGTTMPFQLGSLRVERIGYADMPVVGMTTYAPSPDGMTPIVRQHIYFELASAGISHEVIKFTPTVGIGRRRRFVDCNQSSESLGKNKMGREQQWHFEILREHVRCFVWDWRSGSLPLLRLKQSVLDFMLLEGNPKGRWVYLPDSREGFPRLGCVDDVTCDVVSILGSPKRFATAELFMMEVPQR
jgi:hypothetical protein